MIVPPGTPIVFLVFWLLFHTEKAIVCFQYFLFGLDCVLCAEAVRELLYGIVKNQIINRFFPLCAAILFARYALKTNCVNPALLLTENYTVFLICLILLLCAKWKRAGKNKVLYLFGTLLLLCFFRPACIGMVFVAAVAVGCFEDRKKLPYKAIVAEFCVFGVLLGINGYINCRETGEFVIIENYSGQGIWLANNENTIPTWYDSSMAVEMMSSEMQAIQNNDKLSYSEKNSIYSTKGKEYILHHPLNTLNNMRIKNDRLFINGISLCAFVLFILGLLLLRGKQVLSSFQMLVFGGGFFMISVTTVLGLLVLRYIAPVIPFYAILGGASIEYMIDCMVNSIPPKK